MRLLETQQESWTVVFSGMEDTIWVPLSGNAQGFWLFFLTGCPLRSIVLFPSETLARVFTMGKSL